MSAGIPFKHILVATDFHESSQRAIDVATRLALAAGGELTVEHTVEMPSYSYLGMGYATVDILGPLEEAAQKRLDAAVRALSENGVHAKGVLRRGVVWEHILDEANEANADLIVMGTHGRKGVVRALLGSVAEKVVRMSPIPVLTVHGEADT
jgi:nucleotide-binding universal stress UspA family protein